MAAPKPASPPSGGGGFKIPSIIELVAHALGIGIGEKVGEGAKEAMGPRSAFESLWPREDGESLFSVANVAKFTALLAGLGIYKKVDPFPNSKADNFAVYGLALYLASKLVLPRKNDTGSHFGDFEGNVFAGLAKDPSLIDVMTWMNGLDHRQERQLEAMLATKMEDKEERGKILDALSNPQVRAMLSTTLEKRPPSPHIHDIFASPEVIAADQKAADALRSVRANLPWLRK